jgi:hypothetical protein
MKCKYGVALAVGPNWNALPRMAERGRREWAVVDLDTMEELSDRYLSRTEAVSVLEAMLRDLADLVAGTEDPVIRHIDDFEACEAILAG